MLAFSSTKVVQFATSYRTNGHCVLLPKPSRGDKKQDTNTIISTSFALKCLSNKMIDVDILLFFNIDSQFKSGQFNLWQRKFALKYS